MMKDNTLILVRMFREKEDPLYLFCRRMKDPWKGLYNFVGGKVEDGELPWDCAIRELKEETGLEVDNLDLLCRLTYYFNDGNVACNTDDGLNLWVYAINVNKDTYVTPEKNPLLWLPLSYYFSHRREFAGEGNVGMLIEYYERIIKHENEKTKTK